MSVTDEAKTEESAELFFEDLSIRGLRLLFCGTQKCAPGHSYGPHLRPYFLMVFIHGGRGVFRTQDKAFQLGAGSTFFLFPGEVCRYEADREDPWEYTWIAFDCAAEQRGVEQLLLHDSVSAQQPVHMTQDYAELDRLYRSAAAYSRQKAFGSPLKVMSLFWDILYRYSAVSNQTNRIGAVTSPGSAPLSLAIGYVKCCYARPISVSSAAEYAGVSREYLCELFKKNCGVSPGRFITLYRLQTAAALLGTTDYSIARIADLTGFSDYNYFSNDFLKLFGVRPTAYRRKCRAGERLPDIRGDNFTKPR